MREVSNRSVVARYMSDFFEDSETSLRFGDADVAELAEKYGTPLYLFDANTLRERARAVHAAMGRDVEVLFSLKANPNAAVARVLREAGCGVELASAGEVHIARLAGFRGEQAQFAGPGKQRHDLAEALHFGLSTVNLESEAEYTLLSELARKAARAQRPGVAVRLNAPRLRGGRMRMSGARRKFGFDLETVPAMLERIRRDAVLEFVGFHLYAGTQCFDARHWLENAHYLVDFATRIEKDLDVPVKTLNFGGGFGVECFEGDSRFDLEAAGKGLSSLLRLPEAARRRHFIELGRYLTAPAGIYVTRVISIRRRSDVPYIVLDGGLHHHAAAAGVGSLIPRPFPLVRVRSPLATHSHTYAIGGPLCTSLDEFAEEVCLPELMEGDLVAVLASGAYGLTYSNVLFLSHPTPAEVLLDRSGPALVRRRGRPEDALLGQLLPEAAC